MIATGDSRLVVEGKLIAPWAAELRSASDKAKADLRGRELVIEMKHLTAISDEGENVIVELIKRGTKFKFGKQSMRGPRRLRRMRKKSMQNTNTDDGTNEHKDTGVEKGAAQQLEQILTDGLAPLYRRAFHILGNTADAEDAVQDALLAAYTHLNQFKGQAQISTWLTTIVLNCARMQLRRRSRHVYVSLDESNGELQPLSVSERLADHRPNPEDESIESELSARLSHLHRQLSPTLRRAFQLRNIDGLSIRETARILGVPTGTVKAQSARARKRLKHWMPGALRPRSRRLPDRSLSLANSAVDTGALG